MPLEQIGCVDKALTCDYDALNFEAGKRIQLDIEAFQALSTDEVARLVRASGTRTCVFPTEGTRRWFMLEHPPTSRDPLEVYDQYLETAQKRHIELFQMILDHGFDTLLASVFRPFLLERNEAYSQMAIKGIAWVAVHPDFRRFYEKYDIRVGFYGDYHGLFDGTAGEPISTAFDEIIEATKHHTRHQVWYGVFDADPMERISELAGRAYLQDNAPADRQALIRLYYGDDVPPADLYIGFDHYADYDMPLLATGREHLYFMKAPSLYLNQTLLRTILHDHLYYVRPDKDDYSALGSDEWRQLRARYQSEKGEVFGVGRSLGFDTP